MHWSGEREPLGLPARLSRSAYRLARGSMVRVNGRCCRRTSFFRLTPKQTGLNQSVGWRAVVLSQPFVGTLFVHPSVRRQCLTTTPAWLSLRRSTQRAYPQAAASRSASISVQTIAPEEATVSACPARRSADRHSWLRIQSEQISKWQPGNANGPGIRRACS